MTESELKILCKVLGIENIRQLETEIKNTRNQVKDATIGTKEWTDASEKLSKQLTLKTELMKGARSEQSKLMQSYFALGESIRGVEQALMAVAAAYAATKTLVEFSETAARVEMLRAELQALGKKENFNATELINQMSEAAGGSVTQIDLMQIALRAVRLGNIDLEKMPAIMSKIEKESKLAGVGTREMFDLFIRGAETGSAKFQVQFGLLYDVKKAQEEYAKSVGTTSEHLSEEEQRMVKVNAAFTALLKRQETATTEGEKTIERFEKLNAIWEKVKITLGDIVGIPLSKFLLSIGMEAIVVADAFSAVYHTAVMAYKAIKFDFAGAEAEFKKIASLGDDIRKQFKAIGDMWTGVEQKAPAVGKIGGTPTPIVHTVGAKEQKDKNAELEKQLKIERDRREIIFDIQREEAAAFEKGFEYLKLRQDAYPEDIEAYIKRLKLLQESTKDETLQLKIQKEILKATGDQAKADEKAEKEAEKKERDRLKRLKNTYDNIGIMNQAMISGTVASFDRMAMQFSSAWEGMWARNIGNTQTLLAQFIQSVVDEFAAMAAKLASYQVISWLFPSLGGIGNVFNLFGGGGGSIFSSKTSSNPSNAINTPQIDMSKRSGGRDIGIAQISKAINNLQIVQKTSSRGMSTMVLGGNRVLEKNTY